MLSIKLCECGCGAVANRRFLPGHYRKTVGKVPCKNHHGYWRLYLPDHPLSGKDGYIRQIWVIAEKVLGKPLPLGTILHHIDGNPLNDEHSNLVICDNHKYHMLLHVRQRALKECGDANKRKCIVCQNYDKTDNMVKWNGSYSHDACKKAHGLEYYYKNKTRISEKYYQDREAILKKRKGYYNKNKAKIMAQHKEYIAKKRLDGGGPHVF